MPTYIRVKQINQEELSGFFSGSISNQNSLLNSIIRQSAVINTGDQNISGVKTFFNNANFGNIYSTGIASFNINLNSSLDLSGNSIIFDHDTTTGKFEFNANSGIILYHQNNKYNPNYAPITITTGNDVLINGNTSFGQYNLYFGEANNRSSRALRDYIHYSLANNLNNFPSGLKNNNILNIYYGVNDAAELKDGKYALKCDSFILSDLPENSSNFYNKNYISITEGMYSGKALKRIKYGTTVGNGYSRLVLKGSGYWHNESVRSGSFPYGGKKYVNGQLYIVRGNSVDLSPPIIRPKTYHLETFYDIIVPSGGGQLRPLKFELPNSPGKIQGQVLNLAFHFEPDNIPQIVSGFYVVKNPLGNPIYTGNIFTLTGANYAFSQKERIVCVKHGNFKEAPSNDPTKGTGPIFNEKNIYYYERW